MATIKCKGLTGVTFDLTVTMGSTTMNGLTALAQAVEGHNITTSMYGEISAAKNPSINQTNDGAKTLTAAGLVDGDIVICTPADDPATLTKEQRADQKLYIAEAKRKGLAADDTTATYYRNANTYDKTMLPNPYEGDDYNVDDDENTGSLIQKRPWDVGAIAAPASIADAVQGETLVDLQVWYDAADPDTYVPSATDELEITQLTDKSNFAHNANPNGGNAKPSFENTDTTDTNGNGYLEFESGDCLKVSPFTQIVGQANFTFFVVAKAPNVTGNKVLTAGGAGGDDLTIKFVGSDIVATMTSSDITAVGAGDTDWHYYTYLFDGDQSQETEKLTLRQDGSQIAAGSTGIGATTKVALAPEFYIGNNDDNNAGWSGYIGEVIMFNRLLTATEYGNVENYLSNKWDI